MAKSTAVLEPNFGLYFDRTPLTIPDRGLVDGYNFRIKNGRVNNLNLGWVRFSPNFVLNGPVTLIDNFFPRNLDEKLIFGTPTDLYRYDAGTDNVVFLTPRYEVGTASASGTAVTGVGTDWVQSPVIINAGDEITFGTAGVTNPAAVWHRIATVNSDTSITLTLTAGVIANGPYTIRRKFDGTRPQGWDFDTFVNDGTTGNDLWFATNGIDWVATWDGIATQVVLHPELGFTCKTLATFSNMMLYSNIQQGVSFLPTDMINSNVGFPLQAGATGTGLSAQFRVHSGTDEVINLVPLGDILTIYSNRRVVTGQFVGSPLIFIFRDALAGVGPVSPDAIADFGDFHEFLGADTGYSFDGVGLRETNGHVLREALRQTDPVRKSQVFAHFDEENGDLVWSVPSTLDADVGNVNGQAETAWVEHYLEVTPDGIETPFSKRKFPFTTTGYFARAIGLTWATAGGTWADANYAWNDQFFQLGFPQNLAGDKNGFIWIFNESQTANGVLLPSFIRFGHRATGSGRERDLLTRVYPFADPSPGQTLTVNIWMSDTANAGLTSKGAYAFSLDLPEGQHFVTPYRRGRFWSVQFGSTGTPWQLIGYDFDMVSGGRR